MDANGPREGDSPLARLVEVVDRLRGPEGCPWDRSQTVASVKRYLLDETYEVLEAIASGDAVAIREELGDLLSQIVFLARLHAEQGAFDLAAVAETAAAKLVSRHPHVFAGHELSSTDDVVRSWSDLKARARGEPPGARSLLDGVPTALPALERSLELTDRAARHGFDWPDAVSVLAKIEEELGELKREVEAGAATRIGEELGDLLFAVANLGRKLGANPEEALQGTNRRFTHRFQFIERELKAKGRSPREATLAEMDELWDEAKRRGL